LEFSIAAILDPDVFDHAAIDHTAVRRFDKAELVDTSKARKRRYKANVRAFRRLDRADAAVVRRVNVANLKAGPFTRKSARPEGRQASFVCDLGEGVGLI